MKIEGGGGGYKEDLVFYSLVFYGIFYKRNFHFPIRYRKLNLVKACMEQLKLSVKKLALRACVPTSVSRSPKLPLVFL